MSKTEPKKKLNHVKNLSYGIGASVLVAFLVSVANPINGWVFGLITIVIVTLPMTLITVIVHNVQARRSRPESLVKAESTPAAQTSEVPARAVAAEGLESDSRSAKDFKAAGRVHLGIGLVVLTVAVVNLFIAQTLPLWTRMFAEPFWWIIAACSIVSFVLANSNYYKASELELKKQDGESKH